MISATKGFGSREQSRDEVIKPGSPMTHRGFVPYCGVAR